MPRPPSGKAKGLPGWVWIGFALILLFCVPWYFPAGGAARPYVWAFPFWGFIITGFCVSLAVYTAWVCLVVWKTGRKK